jgi:signal transduction histidine kinase
VIREGKAVLYSVITDEDLIADETRWPVVGTRDPKTLAEVRRIGLKSFMIVPLVVRGKVIGAMSIASGRSHRKYTENDLWLAEELGRRCAVALDSALLYRDALKTIQVREDFLSVASHELRTPLTPLRMQFDMALFFSKTLPSELPIRKDLLEVVEGAGKQMDRLLRLVDNLLDVSRITAGRLKLQFERCDLGALVSEVVRRFEPEMKKAACSVSCSLPREVFGFCDASRIDQVISNLLSNAMKFGEGKPIEMTLEVNAGEAHLRVKDHGIGVLEEDRQRIFERFERAASSRSYRGLGLGLYISREIIDAHSGKISVEPSSGGGAIFLVRLPLGSDPTHRDQMARSTVK